MSQVVLSCWKSSVRLRWAFDAKVVDVTTGEFVEIVDVLLVKPLDELLETIAVGLQRCVSKLVAAFVDVVDTDLNRGAEQRGATGVHNPPGSTLAANNSSKIYQKPLCKTHRVGPATVRDWNPLCIS
jgi:hypothetical protein